MRYPRASHESAGATLLLARRVLVFLLPLLSSFVLAPTVGAQNVTLDQGTFRLHVAGRDVGTENFTIVQSGTGGGVVFMAQGEAALDTAGIAEEVRTRLRVVGPSLRPAAYEVAVQGQGQRQISGRVIGSRFSATIVSSTGEERREYLASEGAVLVDDGVAHQLYFLAQRFLDGAARVPVIIPREGRQISISIADAGSSGLEIGGRTVQARRLTLTTAGGEERDLWVDDRGRVLQYEVPARRFVACRTALPR